MLTKYRYIKIIVILRIFYTEVWKSVTHEISFYYSRRGKSLYRELNYAPIIKAKIGKATRRRRRSQYPFLWADLPAAKTTTTTRRPGNLTMTASGSRGCCMIKNVPISGPNNANTRDDVRLLYSSLFFNIEFVVVSNFPPPKIFHPRCLSRAPSLWGIRAFPRCRIWENALW